VGEKASNLFPLGTSEHFNRGRIMVGKAFQKKKKKTKNPLLRLGRTCTPTQS